MGSTYVEKKNISIQNVIEGIIYLLVGIWAGSLSLYRGVGKKDGDQYC